MPSYHFTKTPSGWTFYVEASGWEYSFDIQGNREFAEAVATLAKLYRQH